MSQVRAVGHIYIHTFIYTYNSKKVKDSLIISMSNSGVYVYVEYTYVVYMYIIKYISGITSNVKVVLTTTTDRCSPKVSLHILHALIVWTSTGSS